MFLFSILIIFLIISLIIIGKDNKELDEENIELAKELYDSKKYYSKKISELEEEIRIAQEVKQVEKKCKCKSELPKKEKIETKAKKKTAERKPRKKAESK